MRERFALGPGAPRIAIARALDGIGRQRRGEFVAVGCVGEAAAPSPRAQRSRTSTKPAFRRPSSLIASGEIAPVTDICWKSGRRPHGGQREGRHESGWPFVHVAGRRSLDLLQTPGPAERGRGAPRKTNSLPLAVAATGAELEQFVTDSSSFCSWAPISIVGLLTAVTQSLGTMRKGLRPLTR